MDFSLSRHLLARTGFGLAPAAEVDALARLSLEQAVSSLLQGTQPKAQTPWPSWMQQTRADSTTGRMEMERKDRRKLRKRRAQDAKAWWFAHMLATPSALTERMTLFWHNHFTSSLKKTRRAAPMLRQNALLRKHALGSFRTLLHAIAKDPAMLVYLDTQSSTRGKPNENFARELLELFTLGEGHYTEADIKEAARAFTGWKVQRKTGRFRKARRHQDTGQKTFLGRQGAWDGEDILDIILKQERTAIFLVEQMWRAFVSPSPDARQVSEIADVFRRTDYDIARAMKSLLTCAAFRDPVNRGTLIKSPVDLTVGTVRALGLTIEEPVLLARVCRRLGQDLLNPPNVKGWPGGEAWITSHTLLLRRQVLGRATRGQRLTLPSQDKLIATLLPCAPVDAAASANPRAQVMSLLLDPVYQLK